MEFGIQFFPDIGPAVKPADAYFDEALRLCALADPLGYAHIRTVEHYFEPYGGYSPNPIVFLSAAAMASRRARLVTGAVLPDGADTVVMQEQVVTVGGSVLIGVDHPVGSNVRLAGEDLQPGQTVLESGRWLTPADSGVLASMGCGFVKVRRRIGARGPW